MICKRPLNVKVFEGASEDAWQQCLDLALQQDVLAMTFPAMISLPKELFYALVKWMAYAQNVVKQSEYKREMVKKMGSWLARMGCQPH